jgi:FkbM family methyltransferase
VKKLLDELAIDCVLDVGAFDGEWASGLRKLGYEGRIVSYEPAAPSYLRLQRRAARDPLWTTVCAAVGARSETVSLRISTNPQMTSLLEPSASVVATHRDQIATIGRESVRLVRLQDEWPGGRVMLKCDTQGSDLAVLRGCGESMADVELLQIELAIRPSYEGQPHYLDVLRELEEEGLQPVDFYPFFWDDHDRMIECDCLFRR